MKGVLLGYEVGNGKPVHIPISHLIVTGITQLSGKTTTLEALIQRSNKKAIVFKTKIGETGFSEGTIIPPYFSERTDWKYIESLLSATLKEKLFRLRPFIMRVSENATSLIQVKENIDKQLSAEKKLHPYVKDMYFMLREYFNLVLPQIQYASFSKTFTPTEGLNIIDLERFSEEVQSLVIVSVLNAVLKEHKQTIVVIPEAWKFCPQDRGNPVKLGAESLIRQGATQGNYLWMDSQDMAGVEKTLLKQVSTWILGLQQERNEVAHTLDQIPVPKRQKPKEDEIMTLGLGQFFVCTPEMTKLVYVCPSWLDSHTAQKIAKGKMQVGDIERPSKLVKFTITPKAPERVDNFEVQKLHASFQRDIAQLREDFFNKIQQVVGATSTLQTEVYKLQTERPDVGQIASLVLQKMPQQSVLPVSAPSVSEDSIITKVLERMPKIAGQVTYSVSPLEKIRKDFLEEAKQRIFKDVQNLTPDHKKTLKYIETQGKGTSINNIVTKCFILTPGGNNQRRIGELCKDLDTLLLAQKDTSHGLMRPGLKKRIMELLGTHEAKPEEIDLVYNHILAEMLK